MRYATDVVGGLGRVTAPPYDAIDDAEQSRLYDVSAFNVVRLELARTDDGAGHDRYTRAARTYAAWRRSGVLTRDRVPHVYVYEETATIEGERCRQRGVLAALELAPWNGGEVLPHERTFRGPIEDRLRLLRALPVNVSPVFTVAERTPDAVADLLEEVTSSTPWADFVDRGGVHHRLWPVGDPEAVATVAGAYRPQRLFVADGHHRYTTALEHHASDGGDGSGAILAYVTGADQGPRIRATHRQLAALPADALAAIRDAGFTTTRTAGDPADLADAVAGDDVTLGLVAGDGAWLLHAQPRAWRLTGSAPATTRSLGVALLDRLLAGPLGVDPETVSYSPDLGPSIDQVERGELAAVFVTPPVTFDELRRASEAGHLLPPKSTSFAPKPRTGLVLRPLREHDPSGT